MTDSPLSLAVPAGLPLWPTVMAILRYVWRQRGMALRYAAVPVVLLIAVDAVGAAAGVDIGEDRIWQLATTALALLAYAPLVVTWYAAVVFGAEDARKRAWFTFGHREGAVVMMNVLVGLVIVVAAIPLGGAVAIVAAGVYQLNEIAGQVTAVVLGLPAAFAWFMIFTRLSLAIAFAAAGRHIGLRDTWTLTKPVAINFTLLHLALGVVGVGVSAAAVAAVGAALEAAGLGGDGKSPVFDVAVSAADTLFGVVYLLLATTLFGVVYRQLAPPETLSPSEA